MTTPSIRCVAVFFRSLSERRYITSTGVHSLGIWSRDPPVSVRLNKEEAKALSVYLKEWLDEMQTDEEEAVTE